MKVQWMLPDHTRVETAVADIEQLMFLLRLVNRVELNGHVYQLVESRLLPEPDAYAIAIWLK